VAEAAQALTHLHTHEPPLVHGDVKPANLILSRGGHVKLVDFGLSSSGEVPHEPPSRSGDVRGLAATAHVLLTGGPPGTPWPDAGGGEAARLEEAVAAGLRGEVATPGELAERLRAGWEATLPTGVMTFCMSDIEDSTRLWEVDPAAMAEALVRHDELIAGVVHAHGGHFLKSMGEGDSTVSVFESAAEATRAAIAAVAALAGEPWPETVPIRARFGLHTGEAQMRGGVYFGTTPNLGARVRGAAGGGEILMSQATAVLVSRDLPPGYELVDVGVHTLKGIAQPERLLALCGPGLATAPTAPECPYRGLLAFGPEDRHLFFGREEMAAEVAARVGRPPTRLLAVVGASGSGKSSLLRAGLIAAVRAGEVDGVSAARLITPGAEPSLPPDDPGTLLVVDQFEELYTQCRDAEQRSAFIGRLLTRAGPVAIGVRADFYAELSADPGLARAVAANQVLLGPMRDVDLRRAIAEPARLAGLRLEPGLVDLVLRDVAGEPGALPLMSHALRETWERRDGRTLTVEAYRASGGVSSALALSADAVVAGTPERDRALLRGVFLRLTELGDEVDDTRRRARLQELVPQGASADSVRALLERLAEARLVILDEGTAEVAHEVLIRSWPTLRGWLDEDREGIRLHRRLGDAARLWDLAGREPGDLYRGARLAAAVEWARTGGELLNAVERDFLSASAEEAAHAERRQQLANRRLRRALAGSGALLLAALALLVFALISRHDAVRASASARSQALATEAESQVARDPQRALLLGRAALAAAPSPQAELAVSEALDANNVRAQLPSFGPQGCLTANFLFLFDGGRLAADNTCDGHVVFGDLVTRRLVGQVRVGPASTDMVLGAGGHTLIVATGRRLVSLDVRTRRVTPVFTAPFTIDQVAGPPGRQLAIADNDTVALVDLRRHRLHVIARGDASVNIVNGMMWASRDVLLVATTGQTPGHGDLGAGLDWLNVASGARGTLMLARPPHLAAVNFLRVPPDGRTWYVTGSDINATNASALGTTWAVDPRTHRVRWVARGPAGAIASPIQASPDSRLVAVGYSTGAADVLDAATGGLVVRDTSSSSIAAGDLAIPPGDDSLITVSLDGVFRTWAIHRGAQLEFQAPPDPAVDFTPDGRALVLVGARGELVERATGRAVRRFAGFPVASVFNTCNSACFSASPGLGWLTYVDPASATPRIVELAGRTGRRAGAITVPRLDAQGVAPDGRVAVAWVNDGRLFAELGDVRTGTVRRLPTGTSSAGCAAGQPSFSADARLLAVVDSCLHLVVWDVRARRIVRTVALPDRSNGTGGMLSPDGRYVLVSVLGGAFVRVAVGTGRVREVPGAQAEGSVLAIAPNGAFYAIGRQDGTVDEYDARSLRLVRHHLLAHAIQALAFSPDSRALAIEDSHDTIQVWDTCDVCESPRALARLAAEQSVRNLTPGERATFGVD
jgi:class 3 adenylate cyclase/WD40 repeat protein